MDPRRRDDGTLTCTPPRPGRQAAAFAEFGDDVEAFLVAEAGPAGDLRKRPETALAQARAVVHLADGHARRGQPAGRIAHGGKIGTCATCDKSGSGVDKDDGQQHGDLAGQHGGTQDIAGLAADAPLCQTADQPCRASAEDGADDQHTES